MWGRLPGVGSAPPWGCAGAPLEAAASRFVLTLPVAFHCLWALGFGTTSLRVVVHSLAWMHVLRRVCRQKCSGLRFAEFAGDGLVPLLGGKPSSHYSH